MSVSYAARTGRPANVGVIGVAVFREARPLPLANYQGIYRHRAQRPAESLGTGHGARESSPARYASFERESLDPAEVSSIGYDSSASLVARGVIPASRSTTSEPRAFPNPFVPDPS